MALDNSTSRLAGRLDGLLFFPVTAFDPAGGVDLETYRQHLKARVAAGPAAIFACCGTGEFFSLDPDEYEACVRVAVEEAAGRIPVVAGAGHGTRLAVRFAEAAARSGADGLLVMPPYLVKGSQAGLVEHYRQVAAATDLEVIVYQRDNVLFTSETVAELAGIPGIAGFKDGRGDLDLMRRIVGTVRRVHGEGAMLYFNGMPTAEMSAQAYRAVGVPGYSSAVFCFAPDLALAFFRAYRAGDDATVNRLLDGFWLPYVQLRQQGPEYAVSLVKAGVRLDGTDVGQVRPPLSEPRPEHIQQLADLIAAGRSLLP
jgi:5-dehydro-4-deoxyglucarate dehydratase